MAPKKWRVELWNNTEHVREHIARSAITTVHADSYNGGSYKRGCKEWVLIFFLKVILWLLICNDCTHLEVLLLWIWAFETWRRFTITARFPKTLVITVRSENLSSERSPLFRINHSHFYTFLTITCHWIYCRGRIYMWVASRENIWSYWIWSIWERQI